MAVRESSPGRGKTTYNTPSVFTRLDTLETEVGGIVVPDVTGKADKTYVDSQDGVLSAQLADISTVNNHSVTYGYDGSGNVQTVTEKDNSNNNVIKTVTYTYNASGDVATSVTIMNGKTVTTTYNYDSNGNITSTVNAISDTGGSSPP